MKKQIITTTVIALLGTGIIFSCKKKDDPAPDNTNTTTTGSTTSSTGSTTGNTTGGSSNLQNNQWSANGVVYTATTIANNPYFGKDTYGTPYLRASTVNGDTTIVVEYRFSSYLVPSGNYSIVQAAQSFQANTVNVSFTKSFTTPPYSITNYVTTGGTATVTNTGGVFTIESASVGLNNMSLSSKLTFVIPTIPSANANYTSPIGITVNQYNFAGTNHIPNQLTIGLDASGFFKFEGAITTSSQKALKYWFNTCYPLSGNYDVVASKSALTTGKIYIEYVNTSPIEQYGSLAGTTATVITDANDVSVTVNNVVLNKMIGAGNQTVTVTGNLTH